MEDLRKIIQNYKDEDYANLVKLIKDPNTYEIKDGKIKYQVEVLAVWEDKTNETIRVSIFMDQLKKRWWQIGRKSVYSAIVKRDNEKSEWLDPLILG